MAECCCFLWHRRHLTCECFFCLADGIIFIFAQTKARSAKTTGKKCIQLKTHLVWSLSPFMVLSLHWGHHADVFGSHSKISDESASLSCLVFDKAKTWILNGTHRMHSRFLSSERSPCFYFHARLKQCCLFKSD